MRKSFLTALLAGVIACTGASAINEAKAQEIYNPAQRQRLEDEAMALGVMGTALHSGMVPARTLDDARFLHGLGHTTQAIAWHRQQQLRNESIRYSRPDIQIHVHSTAHPHVPVPKIKVPRTGTFVCNYLVDFDRNGFEYPFEYEGLGKKHFKSNEALTLGVRLGPHTGKWTLKIYNPKGEEIVSQSEFVNRPNQVRFAQPSVPKLISQYGEGTYTAAFYLNNRFWDKDSFQLSN
jgi:hypothetical protein